MTSPRAAAIYTLLGTAKVNALDPERYLRYIFERIAEHPITRVAKLLPWHVDLKHLQPAIWRRLIVPTAMTHAQLHRVLQIAMGWTDSHLLEFTIAGRRYAIANPEWPELGPTVGERPIKLASLPQSALRCFTYLYDFGDHWEHAGTLSSYERSATRNTSSTKRFPSEWAVRSISSASISKRQTANF